MGVTHPPVLPFFMRSSRTYLPENTHSGIVSRGLPGAALKAVYYLLKNITV